MYLIAAIGDRAMATGNMYRKFGEIWTVGFEICEKTEKTANRQTNKQMNKNIDIHTDTLITVLRQRTKVEVASHSRICRIF